MEQITYISISYSFIDITLISGYLLLHYKYRRFRLRVNCRINYCKYIESILSLLRWGNPKVPPTPLPPSTKFSPGNEQYYSTVIPPKGRTPS